MTAPDTAPLRPPEIPASTAPASPEQWHEHPFVWAWNVIAGAESPAHLEGACRRAKEDGAPAQAVYKTGPNDPTMPNTWVLVDVVAEPVQQRVRDYVKTILGRAEARKELPVRPTASPTPRPEPAPESQGDAPEYEFAISYIARLTGVVKAHTYQEALAKLVPPDAADASGEALITLTGANGVTWRAHFDAAKPKPRAESTTGALRNASVLRQLYDDKPKL